MQIELEFDNGYESSKIQPVPMNGTNGQHPLAPNETVQEVRASEPKASPKISFDVSLLALSEINGLGRKGIQAFVSAFAQDLSHVWDSDADTLQEILREAKVPSIDDVVQTIISNRAMLIESGEAAVDEMRARSIFLLARDQMPNSLLEIPDAPHWLFVEGDPDQLKAKPTIAVVGTRNASDQGMRAARALVRFMSPYEVTVISGLAEGIDAAAHMGALDENIPNIAFLGHGINVVFPKSTAAIRKRIVEEGGAVISEYLPYEHYQKRYFVERNRLQAALADLVIPVEAQPKSGTAHTIRYANLFGRRVIGIRWNGVNEILAQLEDEGCTIIDIYTEVGQKQLDLIIQTLVSEAGHFPFSLRKIVDYYARESRCRNIKSSDVIHLVEEIKAIYKGRGNGHNT